MSPEQFLQLANRLALSAASGPAEFRTAISRAYYGIFHTARQVLNEQMQFYCKSGANEHQWIQRHFANCSSKIARKAGRLIQTMHDARKQADYELANAIIENIAEARAALERAEEVKKLLQLCGSPANVATIKAEMLQYRRLANVQ